MRATSFKGMDGGTVEILQFGDFIGMDIAHDDSRRMPINLDRAEAAKVSAFLAELSGGDQPKQTDDEVLVVLVKRMEAAVNALPGEHPLKPVLAVLTLLLVLDDDPATTAAVRALVGA